MYKKIKKTEHILIMLALVLMLALSACGPAPADATPTMSVDAIFTAAFQTLTAQQATQLALTPPTEIPSTTPLPLPTQPGILIFVSPTTSSGTGVQSCNNSAFVKDVTIPDGTTETPGNTYVKTWSLLNSGTCAWSTSYKFTFISGDAMNGTAVPVPSSVPSGQQVQISVTLTAPTALGNYKGYWRMQDDQGRYFGDSPWVAITVSGSATATSTGATNTTAPTTNTPVTPTNTPVTPAATPT